MNKIIVTGYMGSGSSAFTDLLSEFSGICNPQGDFEYVFLHCPNGLFDLEDKLLQGNNALRSDEAIKSFLIVMKSLHNNGRWWFGGYKDRVTPEFMKYAEEFVDSILTCTFSGFWYEMEKVSRAQYIGTKLREMLGTPRHDIFSQKLYAAFPTAELFYESASTFIEKVLQSVALTAGFRAGQFLLLDQLLLPHNLAKASNYFPNNDIRVLVISRDPRDVYIQNKYFWHASGCAVPLPEEPKAFCEYYRKMRSAEKKQIEINTLRLNFEDLVFDYKETLTKVLNFIEGDPGKHSKQYERFDPKKSIANVGIFASDEKYCEESNYIAEHLAEYLYPDMNKHLNDKSFRLSNSPF